MADISNRTLAILVGVAIIISVVGIFVAQKGAVTVTGMASGTGVANLTITSFASINVSGNIEFGEGAVYLNSTYAEMDSSDGTVCDDTATCEDVTGGAGPRGGNWTFQVQNILVENNGNENVSLETESSAVASSMIGGTGAVLNYTISDNVEATSCDGGVKNGSASQAWGTAATKEIACNNLLSEDANDILNLTILVRVPVDASPGVKTTTITFTGTAI